MTTPIDPDHIKTLVAWNRHQAASASEAERMMAEAKSLRQGDCNPPRADLYSWSKPEQTREWETATQLEALLAAYVEMWEVAKVLLKGRNDIAAGATALVNATEGMGAVCEQRKAVLDAMKKARDDFAALKED